jgi:hypothetical protein
LPSLPRSNMTTRSCSSPRRTTTPKRSGSSPPTWSYPARASSTDWTSPSPNTTDVGVVEVTGYGHFNCQLHGETVRTFVFTVTADDPERVCRWASITHRWSLEPLAAALVVGDTDAHPTPTAFLDPLIAPPKPIDCPSALQANAKGRLCSSNTSCG